MSLVDYFKYGSKYGISMKRVKKKDWEFKSDKDKIELKKMVDEE